jgi:hypothetical protein
LAKDGVFMEYQIIPILYSDGVKVVNIAQIFKKVSLHHP